MLLAYIPAVSLDEAALGPLHCTASMSVTSVCPLGRHHDASPFHRLPLEMR